MSKTIFYIVPKTKSYYDTMLAESKEEALVKFAEKMDTDMSAYFDVVTNVDTFVRYPYDYEYPKGKFELMLSILLAASGTKYFNKEVYNKSDLFLEHMDAIGNLQRAYEELKTTNRRMARKSRKYFYKALREITGFELDKKEKPNDSEKIHIHIRKNKDVKAAKLLDKKGIPYILYSGDRIVVVRNDLAYTEKILDNAGIKYDIL